MLTLNQLSKKFGAKNALHPLTLEVRPGEIFSLIGPNGSGKTTTVKLIAGMLRPTTGSASIDGYSITEQPIQAKQLLGYVPDEPAVWPGMTGEEFLHFVGSLYGMHRGERNKRMKSLLRQFNLAGISGDYFEDYSRGNKQKFSLVAGLMHSPKLLLVDEPIVGLDPLSIDVACDLLRSFAKSGGSVLLVAHTLPIVQELSDRIGLLRNGTLLAVGTMQELRHAAKVSATANLDEVYKALVTAHA
jgi:ABC-2 type transport system ATP-binding protein